MLLLQGCRKMAFSAHLLGVPTSYDLLAIFTFRWSHGMSAALTMCALPATSVDDKQWITALSKESGFSSQVSLQYSNKPGLMD